MPRLEILAPDTAPFFVYGQDLVSSEEARALLEFLGTVPERTDDEADASSEFFFQRHFDQDPDGA